MAFYCFLIELLICKTNEKSSFSLTEKVFFCSKKYNKVQLLFAIKRQFYRVRGLSLDLIKRRLDKGVYKRLDRFQEDVFTCLERARKLSRTDSQVFEDSVELQAYFLRTRDEVTRNGDLLHSPALNYTVLDLSNQVAELKRMKAQQELSVEDESCDGNQVFN